MSSLGELYWSYLSNKGESLIDMHRLKSLRFHFAISLHSPYQRCRCGHERVFLCFRRQRSNFRFPPSKPWKSLRFYQRYGSIFLVWNIFEKASIKLYRFTVRHVLMINRFFVLEPSPTSGHECPWKRKNRFFRWGRKVFWHSHRRVFWQYNTERCSDQKAEKWPGARTKTTARNGEGSAGMRAVYSATSGTDREAAGRTVAQTIRCGCKRSHVEGHGKTTRGQQSKGTFTARSCFQFPSSFD